MASNAIHVSERILPVTKPRDTGAATAGLILGGLGFLLCWVPLIGLALAGLGLWLSIVGRRRGAGLAAAGLAFSSFGALLSLAITVGVAALGAAQASRPAAHEAQVSSRVSSRPVATPAAMRVSPALMPVTPTPRPAQRERPVAAVAVDAGRLLAAYKANEVAADESFKGKVVEVSGVVGEVKKSIFGDVYVTLGTGSPYEIQAVQCFLDETETGKAGRLTPGDRVTLRGLVDGLMMNVVVKDAVIIAEAR